MHFTSPRGLSPKPICTLKELAAEQMMPTKYMYKQSLEILYFCLRQTVTIVHHYSFANIPANSGLTRCLVPHWRASSCVQFF